MFAFAHLENQSTAASACTFAPVHDILSATAMSFNLFLKYSTVAPGTQFPEQFL
jgi:hypothetical protein